MITNMRLNKCLGTRTAAVKRASVCPRALPKNVVAKNTAMAGATAAILLAAQPSYAELNKFEAAAGGEFGMGTAQQYGEADVKGRDFSNQDLRRSNFTSADCRKCKFVNSKLNGTYFIKAVTYQADFTNADVSDALWDRAVLNEAILRNAILQRTVFTSSDLTGADIYGADFTNALVDRTQQLKLCRYAAGVNPVTGNDTRKSLGCGSRRAFKAQSPSSPDGPTVTEADKEAFRQSMPTYRE